VKVIPGYRFLACSNAQDHLDQMQIGEDSLPIEAAWVVVQQAETSVAQAVTGLAQAKALEVQLTKSLVYAPASGVILARNLEPGEVFVRAVQAW